VTGIEIKIDDAGGSPRCVPRSKPKCSATIYRFATERVEKNLFSALKLEKVATFIILSLASWWPASALFVRCY